MSTFLSWLTSNATVLGFFGTAVAFAWSAVQVVLNRRTELRSQEFTHYHSLIKDLVSPDEKDRLLVSRQAAIIFELRHFPRYYPVSIRILHDLKSDWSAKAKPGEWKILFAEIELTTAFLQKKT